jgi:hypothetical protein
MSASNRWLDWEPQPRISADLTDNAPTKTTESVFDVFVGARSAAIPEIEDRPEPASANVGRLLNQAGVRIMRLEGEVTTGLWSDLDGSKIRAALYSFGLDCRPIRYLDGPGVPTRYKVRRVKGEPVPLSVLAEMERHSAAPWNIRDRMLKEMGWRSKRQSRQLHERLAGDVPVARTEIVADGRDR